MKRYSWSEGAHREERAVEASLAGSRGRRKVKTEEATWAISLAKGGYPVTIMMVLRSDGIARVSSSCSFWEEEEEGR